MQTYDFNTAVDRRNTWSEKWNVNEGELPMSIADMDFRTAPEITEALVKRAQEGVYGYTRVPDEWYLAYSEWWGGRHGLRMEKEELVYSKGVLPTISSSIRKLTSPAEKVLIQTPVYNIFYNCILNNGRGISENPLRFENGAWRMDFDDLEEKLSDPQTTMMLLCNPHNPVGRLWTRQELERVGDLCKDYGVTVLSDEVHCDITDPGKRYVPFASVSDTCRYNSITAVAPTKCFNIAGIETSAAFVPNPFLRHKVWRQLNTDECGEPNFFAITATMAAFNRGGAWLDEMNRYVYDNKRFVESAVGSEIPDVKVPHTEGTYLLWIDCNGLRKGPVNITDHIRKETGLVLADGSIYGAKDNTFMRMNVAYPRSVLEDGVDRLCEGLRSYSYYCRIGTRCRHGPESLCRRDV